MPLAVVKESTVLLEGELGAKCFAGKYVAAILNEMRKEGESRVAAAWADSGLSWVPSSIEVDQFVADNRVEWTLAPSASAASTATAKQKNKM